MSNIKVQKDEIQDRLNDKIKGIEEIRREKEFFSIELVRKNEELKNLQLKLNENKDEVEKLQEKVHQRI